MVIPKHLMDTIGIDLTHVAYVHCIPFLFSHWNDAWLRGRSEDKKNPIHKALKLDI